MNSNSYNLPDGLGMLRQEFHQSFAAPIRDHIQETEDILAFRIAGDSYGLNARQISGITRAHRIVPIPGDTPELLGLVQVRGALVSVYSLAALLGYSISAAQSPCWLALCGKNGLIGLDLGQLEAYTRVSRTELFEPDEKREKKRYISQVARTGMTVRAIIDIASVAESIQRQTLRATPALE